MNSYQMTQTTDIELEETNSPEKEAKSMLIAEDTVEVLLGADEILIKEKVLEVSWYIYCLI